MAISISYLSAGSKIKDSSGNTFIVIAQNHYASGQTTVWTEDCITKMKMSSIKTGTLTYETTDINTYLKNTYPLSLSEVVREHTVATKIYYTDFVSSTNWGTKYFNTKYFLLSDTELGSQAISESNNKKISYLNNIKNRICSQSYWTRTEYRYKNTSGTLTLDDNAFRYLKEDGYFGYNAASTDIHGVRPAFNLSHELMVDENIDNGYYNIVETVPPVVNNVSNFIGNFASATTINYSVTNEEGYNLTHFLSIDNGDTWQEVIPTKSNDDYSFNYVFNEVKTYYCRIKVVDDIGNSSISNVFTVTLSHSIPNITILGHDDLDFRFKVNCITSEIVKVEIVVNNVIQNTFTDNLDLNLSYSIDKSLLTETKSYIQIKATSKAGTVGVKDMEVIKSEHNPPVTNSKVIINNNIYTVASATKVDDNIVLTLKEQLVENISKGDLISILQDSIKVKCSLSNAESTLNYKDMELVKVKTLKGDFEGYIEEKYVLEGEGRYSAIKLELERFSEDVNVEVAELQQMFDYIED